MAGKILYSVHCEKHGKIMTDKYRTVVKELFVAPPKGKKRMFGCPVCLREKKQPA
jgi:hypothetical protein